MKRKMLIYILICVMGVMSTACTKGSSTSDIRETSSAEVVELQTTKAQEPERETPQETETEYVVPELNTVESLEDDGKEMSATEALRSALKGKHSALELVDSFDEKYAEDRVFFLGENIYNNEVIEITETKEYPDEGLSRVNILEYNSKGTWVCEDNLEWDSFICVDMDQDGTKEVFIKTGGIHIEYAILYYAGGEVYISLLDLFNDKKVYVSGIYSNISGAAYKDDEYNNFYIKVYPVKGAIYQKIMAGAWWESGQYHYELDNKTVTKEEYDAQAKAYIEDLTGGIALEWLDFTEENIDKYVVD